METATETNSYRDKRGETNTKRKAENGIQRETVTET